MGCPDCRDGHLRVLGSNSCRKFSDIERMSSNNTDANCVVPVYRWMDLCEEVVVVYQ